MQRVVYTKKNFLVYDTGRDLVVINKKGAYENHAHLTRIVSKKVLRLDKAIILIDLVLKRKVPKNAYLKVAALRLTTDEKYKLDLKGE